MPAHHSLHWTSETIRAAFVRDMTFGCLAAAVILTVAFVMGSIADGAMR